jgi:rare lipoprotein A
MNIALFLVALVPALALIGCGSAPKPASSSADATSSRPSAGGKSSSSAIPALPPAGSGRGGYYQDDGPGDTPPEGLLALPDPEPKVEPYTKRGNRPYVVFGKTYTPIMDERPFKQRGIGSWYGKKFHGQKTSSGELYDMYKMTAAHPTLPIPSYARVTNLNNGIQVIVRVNDRGPFHSGRIIDLSYTAALKLGYLGKGSSELEVERLLPDEIERIAARKRNAPQQADAVPTSEAAPQAVDMTPAIEVNPVTMPIATVSMLEPEPAKPAAGAVSSNAGNTPANGFYLQFGAFTQANYAEAVRTTLSQKWGNSLPPIEIVESGQLFRLHSGPFANRSDAVDAAQQVQDRGLSKPLIVQR